ADVLASLDRQPQAEACVVEALRRAAARQLPAMAGRVRAAAVRLWRPDRIAELSAEDQVGADGGGGRFLVLETLGSGGFGEVERAIDLDTGGEVAVKRLRFNLHAEPDKATLAIATVRNEVAAASRLSNRFVAASRYLHVGTGGSVTLVQDFVAGPTLRRALDDGDMDFGRRMVVAAMLARTVHTLHRAGLVHRDLKPDNVILRGGTQPVLIDLGLARLKGAADTVSGLGTKSYAPPEQMRGETIEPRWFGREDVFALGRMITEMAEINDAASHRRGLLGRLGRRRAGRLGQPLAGMVETMMHHDIARRDVDLNRLADALEAAATD
ncbi:MAG: protein kinase, partial [Hyphomicrobiales bacterium]|nr:protein kinase [Hyphomicrobiales bacterium]